MSRQSPGVTFRRLASIAALAGAVLFSAIVTAIYVVDSGADDAGPPEQPAASSLPFGGTPIPDVEGMPTPIPNTGTLDPQRPDLDGPAPDFALADVRDPSRIRKLSDFSGTPVVLNWYASWCAPCLEELPEFQAAQDALGDDVVFVAVNFIESQSKARGILDDFDITFPAVLDTSGAVTDHYRISTLPMSLLIDAGGIVRAIHHGPLLGNDLEEALASIGVEYNAP